MRQITQKRASKRTAFTMLELIMVIVVLGILASLAMPRLERETRQEAADQILSAIRYTQHLALVDHKHLFDNKNWQRRFWRIRFGTCVAADETRYYAIGSDDDASGSDNAEFSRTEAAIDPISSKPLFWTNGTSCDKGDAGTQDVSSEIFITQKYGLKEIQSSGGCSSAKHIGFDHLGRPHHGEKFSSSDQADYAGYMKTRCTFTFTMQDDETFSIHIEPETGYAFIAGEIGS